MTLPEFAEGIHYKQLRGGKYRFELIEDVAIRIPALSAHRHRVSFRDGAGIEWARIEGDTLFVRKFFSWNGCSPCFWVPLLGWCGTPTPYPVIFASLIHDALYGYIWTENFPLTLKQCDDTFYNLMAANGFRGTSIYHGAVAKFGMIFAGREPGKGDHSILLP